MKRLLSIIVLLGGTMAWGQSSLTWNNPGFEGSPPGSSISPPSWPGCNGSPDTQPGCWGATLGPAAGVSYMGLVYALSIPTSQESAGQTLPTPMVANTPYAMTMSLVNLDIYNGSWNGGAIINIYGGNSVCNFGQLLWTSGSFSNSTWQTFSATFTPTSSWTNFIIRIHPGTSSTWPAAGVDNFISVPLPVKLEAFDAQLVEGGAEVSWQTSEEQALLGYTVQRAGEDMAFEDLGMVPATGNNGPRQFYSYVDHDVPVGLSYYRLRMEDQNGTSTLSEVRQVLNAPGGETILMKNIFPNPAHASARVEIYSSIDQSARMRVIDLSGRIVLEQQLDLSAGETEHTLETETWRAGMYRVQVLAQGTTVSKPLIVTH